jgi:tetraacyldisaccharide 4'-kinase
MRRWFEKTIISIWFSNHNKSLSAGVWGFCLRLVGFFLRAPVVKKSLRQANSKLLSLRHNPPTVVIVGNIIVGGAGKTPIVMAIGTALSKRNLRVGYIASGYASKAYSAPQIIKENSTAIQVGDEALLIFKKTGAAVAVGKDRASALAILCDANELDVVLSDDGLQHEPLRRDIEIVVFDERFAGNERLLPAGPLREPLARLESVDVIFAPEKLYSRLNKYVDLNRIDLSTSHWRLDGFCTLQNYADQATAQLIDEHQFASKAFGKKLHAIAGIANPGKLLSTLREYGLDGTLHAPGDHSLMNATVFKQLLNDMVVMTEKDAVKYLELLKSTEIDMTNCWVAVGHAEISESCIDSIYRRVTCSKQHKD